MRDAWTTAGRVLAGFLFVAGLAFVALVAAGAIFTGPSAVAQAPTPSDIRGTVTDSVTGQGLEGIRVVATPTVNAVATRTAVTGAGGRYLIEDVVPSDYTVLFSDPAFEAVPRDCDEDPHFPAVRSVDRDEFDGDEIVVDAELDPGAHIFGTVRSAATGQAVEDVLVAAAPAFPFAVTLEFALTDGGGAYEMCGMSPAFYDVFFLPDVDTGLNAEIVRDFRLQLGEKRELNMSLLSQGDVPPKIIPIQLSRTEVDIGDEITATSGAEFKANSQVMAFVFSNPVPVGVPMADAAGAVRFDFRVTEAIGAGSHQLRVFGVDQADNAVVGIANFTVRQVTTPTPATPTPATPTPGPTLPESGSDTFPMILIATWSIFVGMLMREHARRHST